MTVLFKNEHWQIDNEGMTSLKVHYPIAKSRMLESREDVSGQKIYEWPSHMVEKSWVDKDAFIEAWLKAIDIFSDELGPLSAETLIRSIDNAESVFANLNDPENKAFFENLLNGRF